MAEKQLLKISEATILDSYQRRADKEGLFDFHRPYPVASLNDPAFDGVRNALIATIVTAWWAGYLDGENEGKELEKQDVFEGDAP